jgi:hypothetical protein
MTNGVKQTPINSEKERLTGLAKHAQTILRRLRMGEIGTISCSKLYPLDEVRSYVYGYAFHKNKWFDIKTDNVSNSLVVTRAPRPKPVKEFDGEEEVE